MGGGVRRSIDSVNMSVGAAVALARWDDSHDGRIFCKEARRHHLAPARRGCPAHPFMRDGDGDGGSASDGPAPRADKLASLRGYEHHCPTAPTRFRLNDVGASRA